MLLSDCRPRRRKTAAHRRRRFVEPGKAAAQNTRARHAQDPGQRLRGEIASGHYSTRQPYSGASKPVGKFILKTFFELREAKMFIPVKERRLSELLCLIAV